MEEEERGEEEGERGGWREGRRRRGAGWSRRKKGERKEGIKGGSKGSWGCEPKIKG